MVKYLLLIGLVLFVSNANAGGYGRGGGGYGHGRGGYGHRSSYGMTYQGYGDGGYGSSQLMAGLLGGLGGGGGGGGYPGYDGGYGRGRGRNIAVVQTPVVGFQDVVRNVPSIQYQNVPQVQYQTQTVARQIPIYAPSYPSAGGYPTGPSAGTGFLNTNSAPIYPGGSQPIYSGGSPVYSGSSPIYSGGSPGYPSGGSVPIYSGGNTISTYPAGGSSGSAVVRGDGTFVPSANSYFSGTG